ncbi:spermatogenesis-associated protein 6-like isoform X2 [Xenia sp. Carnegie-2017]|uniref:spermatogenesis-associated protein 6-like isoform X2 n=1 Tax=Xenia sp. Carnegie-2017 TaxID=2897299 RepID=UPI001F04C01E|nr:spermatogenesis-associated protein 6-like isoform X2 [Xenia sp. Carnegie-2017]
MECKGLSCEVKLDVHLVSCPGTKHLSNRNMLFIRIALLGCSKRTKSVYATFPLLFSERLYFEKKFITATEPSQVMEMLEDENVVIELLQYSQQRPGGKCLASYEESTRKFLFPKKTLTKKNDVDREILLRRSKNFPGINPKLEFSTSTTMEEARISSFYTRHSFSQDNKDNTSDCSDEDDKLPVMQSANERSPKATNSRLSHSLSPMHIDKYYVPEFARRPKNHHDVLKKSMSLSPRLKSRLYCNKPPFKTGKANENIISRRDFPPRRPNAKSLAKLRNSLPNTRRSADDNLFHHLGSERKLRSASRCSVSSYPSRARLPDSAPISNDVAYNRALSGRKKVFERDSDEYSSSKESSDDELHERVAKLLEKTRVNVSDSDSDSDHISLSSLQELRNEIDVARQKAIDRSFNDSYNSSAGVGLDL